jgi:hypothetical protein
MNILTDMKKLRTLDELKTPKPRHTPKGRLLQEHRELWRLNDVLLERIETLADELNDLRQKLFEENNRQEAVSRARRNLKRPDDRN